MRNRIMGGIGTQPLGGPDNLGRLALTGVSTEGLTKVGLRTEFANARLSRVGESVLILLPSFVEASQS
jgi:hypothetical protein